jgi:AraC-like DNA-binding protein
MGAAPAGTKDALAEVVSTWMGVAVIPKRLWRQEPGGTGDASSADYSLGIAVRGRLAFCFDDLRRGPIDAAAGEGVLWRGGGRWSLIGSGEVLIAQADLLHAAALRHPFQGLDDAVRIDLRAVLHALPPPEAVLSLREGPQDPFTRLAARQVTERMFFAALVAGLASGVLNTTASTPLWLAQALAILSQLPPQSFPSLGALAARVGVNPTGFHIGFIRHLGCSYPSYIRGVRIRCAKRMLSERPDALLHEVAERCGFLSHAHFTRAFKSVAGATPSQWARRAAPTCVGNDPPPPAHLPNPTTPAPAGAPSRSHR